MRTAVIVDPLIVPATRTRAPTGNSCAVAEAFLEPKAVCGVTVTVKRPRRSVVTVQVDPFSAVTVPLMPCPAPRPWSCAGADGAGDGGTLGAGGAVLLAPQP